MSLFFAPKQGRKDIMNGNAVVPVSVSFHGDTLAITTINDEPHVAMRPVVEALGLSWSSQAQKFRQKSEKFNCVDINTVASDGFKRKTICIPLRKLNGWLFSVNPEKVKPELREKLMAYQEECFQVLYSHWTNGSRGEAAPEIAVVNGVSVRLGRSGSMELVSEEDAARALGTTAERMRLWRESGDGMCNGVRLKMLKGVGDGQVWYEAGAIAGLAARLNPTARTLPASPPPTAKRRFLPAATPPTSMKEGEAYYSTTEISMDTGMKTVKIYAELRKAGIVEKDMCFWKIKDEYAVKGMGVYCRPGELGSGKYGITRWTTLGKYYVTGFVSRLMDDPKERVEPETPRCEEIRRKEWGEFFPGRAYPAEKWSGEETDLALEARFLEIEMEKADEEDRQMREERTKCRK